MTELLSKLIDAVFRSDKLSIEKSIFAIVIAFSGLVYVFGFNVDNMFQTPHAIFLLLLVDIMFRLMAFLINLSATTKIYNKLDQQNIFFNKFDNVVENFDKLLKVQTDIAKNILSVDDVLKKMYSIVKGKPNKWQLNIFAHLRTKVFEWAVLDYCFKMLYATYELMKSNLKDIHSIPLTSKNKPRIEQDLKELLNDYLHDIEKFIKVKLDQTTKESIRNTVYIYIDDIINVLDTTDDIVEKMNNIIFQNSKVEFELLDLWKFQIRNTINDDLDDNI